MYYKNMKEGDDQCIRHLPHTTCQPHVPANPFLKIIPSKDSTMVTNQRKALTLSALLPTVTEAKRHRSASSLSLHQMLLTQKVLLESQAQMR